MKSLITKSFGITNAKNFEQMISLPLANVYVTIGRSIAWANVSNTALLDDVRISDPYDTTEYKNAISRDGIIMKKIVSSDVQLVAPRVDWANNTVYVPYEQSTNLFVMSTSTKVSGGNVNVSLSLANTVNANSINLAAATPSLSVGSFIKLGENGTEIKEIVSINAAGDFLTVNSSYSAAQTSANLYKVVYSTDTYSNNFYVRNDQDQVFKCLFNNGGIASNTKPEITIDGQLPENPFIETADGYKWKYLYTIPSGLKSKFFTEKYMPVIREPVVFNNAKDGRIDIIKIINGGTGYYAGGSVNNYAVATVTGDGTGATVTVDVQNGSISDINITDGGNNYTTATVTINDPLQTLIGTTANLQAIISPRYGHGYDPVSELGASNQMLSVDFEGDIDGNHPVESDGTDTIRQITILKDPKFSNGVFATASVNQMYTKIYTSNPPVDFSHGSIVYVGSSFATSTFTARVVHFDNDENLLLVNNITGDVENIVSETIYEKDNPSAAAKVFTIDEPDINIFSGEVLYIENKAKIIRSPDQTETVKLVVEF